MIASGNEKIIDYFIAELQSLRQRASLFSEDYPEVASELRLGSGRSDDPHVEILLQSFAYMTARLRYNLDADLPEVPVNLLKHLYPHLETPIPSMGILQVDPYPDTVDFTEGYCLQRGRSFKRKVRAQDNNQYDCYLRAACDTDLWPIKINKLSLLPTNRFAGIDRQFSGVRSVLQVKLETVSGLEFSDLSMQTLRLFVNSSNPRCYQLFDRLQGNLISVVSEQLVDGSEANYHKTTLAWQGFDENQAIPPYTKRSHPAYRLLQEYFSFPEKFLMFDVGDINTDECGSELNLYFLFDVDLSDENIVDNDSLLPNCVPVVNLYNAITEPIRLNQREFEYLLVPDVKQYNASEIYAINKVVGTDVRGRSSEIAAFLPDQDVYKIENEKSYWSSRRDYSERKRFCGTEMYLSFHDQGFNISLPASNSIYAEVTCTNRDLAQHLRIGSQMMLVGEGPASNAVLVTKPTRHQVPAIRGKQPWELVSHLTLNFSTLGKSRNYQPVSSQIGRGPTNNADRPIDNENVLLIQNLLRMYCEADNLSHQRLVDSIQDMHTELTASHIGQDAWRGFSQGMKLSMTIDESLVDHTSVFLFGEVMQRFFALYTAVNSFVSLRLLSNQRDEALKTWPPMTGEKAFL
ncbi:MAG: type VI secretion system baseplate subunit TssF [Arenicella sp.]|nr:type VI secretion system baseplate subunit TssF [Arenicella sp.]